MTIPRIDFVLAGAAKSATTSLHHYLGEHPQIFMPAAKELAYFIAPEGDARASQLMHRYFARARDGQLLGLSEASMLMFHDVPQRIHRHNDRAKAIFVLRNPIERAYSAYWFGRLRGWDDAPTFEDALQRELDGQLATRKQRVDFGYLEQGHYQDHIDAYAAILGAERLRVLLTEDLEQHRERTMLALLEWLGVAASLEGIRIDRKYNVTSNARSPWLARALGKLGGPPARFGRVAFERPAMRPETRELLRNYFAERNPDLGTRIGRDLSGWT